MAQRHGRHGLVAACMGLAGMTVALVAHAADKTLTVGVSDALSGGGAVYGVPELRAIELAVEEVNAAGGIPVGGDAYRLKTISYDDKADPTEATNVARKLLDRDGVKVLLGYCCSASGGAVASFMGREDALMLVGTAGARDITAAGNPNVFRTRPPGDYTGAAAGRYLYDKGVRTLGILGVRDVALFTQYREALIKRFEQAGGKVVALETFGGHDRDMTPQLTKLKRLDPDAVFISGYVEQAAFAYRQFKEIGMKMPRYGFSGGSERQFLKVASSEQMEGVTDLLSVEFSVQALGSENAKRFADAYKKKYGEEPTPNTAYAYDQVYVLRDALKSAQSTSDVKKLIAALRGLPVPKEVLLKYQPIDGKMFDGNGQAYISNGAFQWKQGQWQFLGELPSDAKAYSAYLRSLRK
ncbi:ABC transporter substrate-binding protein [Verminephrobacter eiseniae]|uniref:Extracellular ligand-binding receptor n=1 Tax=Verminephrobacter eiseniae (strain EF01-2) TaxID=391735 RepID=A1WPI8_VEREI|nr:ABC transporter substrate-binding protein [Verminephrobacter eiseniae]ABM59545.1 Extracellular ligand-binding receptor [Verminephrobacter eiseniae EF01-2]